MIKLKTLEVHNFGIFKDIKLDFTDKEIIGILAEYANDSTRSNMSGKSLIAESILYNLVGITRYSKESKMIHYGEDVMWTKNVYVDDNGKEYTIKRGRDSKNNGILELDWIEKTRESQQAIGDIFGVFKEDLELTNFFKQADINGFMNLKPAEKTAYLQKALKNDHWKEKEERVKTDIKDLNIRLKENEAVKLALEESLEVSEELAIELSELKKKNKSLNKKIDEKKDEVVELNKEVKCIEASNFATEGNIKGLEELSHKAEVTEDKIRVIKRKIKNYTKELEGIEIEEVDYTFEDVAEEIAKLSAKLSDIDEKLSLGNSGGVCPLLNESCDRIKFTAKDKKKLVDERDKIASKLIKSKNKRKKITSIEESQTEYGTLKTNITGLKTRLKDFKDGNTVEDLEKKINKLKKKLLKVDDKTFTKITALEDSIDDGEEILSRNVTKIGILNHRITESEKAVDKINGMYAKNTKLVNKIEKLKYISIMFGKSGILADEIENSFTQIQDDINYILKELDCGMTVSFSPDKELAKKESVCSCGFVYYKNYKKPVCEECGTDRLNAKKDEISLQVLDANGNEADFEGNSGGGKAIISYAVRIALTMFKRKQNQCQLNMLFLDEVDSALDNHLASSIINSITKVLTKKLGYDQIIMISHKDEIKNSVPNIIKVIKHDSYSTAKFV